MYPDLGHSQVSQDNLLQDRMALIDGEVFDSLGMMRVDRLVFRDWRLARHRSLYQCESARYCRFTSSGF